jgi:hypothetical protein
LLHSTPGAKECVLEPAIEVSGNACIDSIKPLPTPMAFGINRRRKIIPRG